MGSQRAKEAEIACFAQNLCTMVRAYMGQLRRLQRRGRENDD